MTVFVDRARLHAPAERWLVVAERVSGAIQEGWGSQTAFVAASGLSDATIRKLQGGKQASFRTKTLDQVEDALGWPRGAIRELLEGPPDIPHEAFSDGQPAPDYGDADAVAEARAQGLDRAGRDRRFREAVEGAGPEELADRMNELTRRILEERRAAERDRKS